jgi:hypothetical protein
MQHHTNQRANVRECVQLHADLENARGECPAVTLDLSNSGARLLTSGHIDRGERVVLTLHLADASRRCIRASGTTVRISSLEPDRMWGRMLAMEFDAPLSDSAAVLPG